MTKETTNINWTEIIDKFSKHTGSVIEFCKENNIKQHQLYHQRKKLLKKSLQGFHVIEIPKTDAAKPSDLSIRIEIGNINIFIPTNDQNTLIALVKELSGSC
jgi:hypothetical protein